MTKYFFTLWLLLIFASCVNKTVNENKKATEPQLIDNSILTVDTTSTPLPKESEYKGNKLQNGAAPFKSYFGKGDFTGNATLTVKNGGSADAIICMYNTDEGRVIRHAYVAMNTDYKIRNIAQGNYKIKVFYGNDWNPTLDNPLGGTGYFDSDVDFSEFDGTHYFEDNSSGFTNATITLYTVSNGNASSSGIDAKEFFKR